MDKLQELKNLADRQVKDKARLEGRISSLMDDLKKLGYDSIDEAKKEIKRLKAMIQKKEATLNFKVANFEEKYAEELAKIDR